ncbi:dual specificity protein phosphatase 1-like [Salvia miltiorrhiza]|uniref:dual specificity protein phosphatase 1-like n=1 Tax=Salvia miltiorrhiza TaxID=226208 RepID=UPI0025AC03FD|nr:dual specificity protein phosphatase 1-like [Salvia miltiorrhiza]XP_057771808.1 dual specificity protein phosphatase 1-like [Salvia miltiorrhiza]XP_057771809.1 dual specificity protein phosphatase 1-like [Salvia miltiorrhiza]XP_057771810.1 dual specificity protein phosphatase 1-like [Salvia miltiorrhiza]
MNGAAFKERIAALLKVIQVSKILKDDNIPCLIEEGLFLGSLGAANNRTALKALNVTHVLTVAHTLTPSHPNDFVYKIIEVPDREDVKLSQYFDECFAFIDEARASGGGVLVHCFAGRSRSVTVVVAYLMFKRGMSLSDALGYVRMKRPTICPNRGFISQLQEYAKFLQDARNKDAAAHEPEESGSSV